MEASEYQDLNLQALKKIKDNQHSAEGVLYHDDNTAYKIFDKYGLTEHEIAEKLIKIETLSRIVGMGNVILPQAKIMDGKRLAGYAMPYIKNSIALYDFRKPSVSVHEYYEIIKEVSHTLRKIHEQGIVVTDLNFDNIILDKEKTHYFVDLDSATINGIEGKMVSLLLQHFIFSNQINQVKINKNLDRISLLLSSLEMTLDSVWEFMKDGKYDGVLLKTKSLTNIKPVILEIKTFSQQHGYFPEVPYIDELIAPDESHQLKLTRR